MDSAIKDSYNKSIFQKYSAGKIQQHSVGMQYVKLAMCIDDDDYKEEKANYDMYISHVINKELVEETGYFFAVTEAKLIEISCVIRGSNELTPTLGSKSEFDQLKEYLNNANDVEVKEILHICNSKTLESQEPPAGTQDEVSRQNEKKSFYDLIYNPDEEISKVGK
jgi:hypothetical protein